MNVTVTLRKLSDGKAVKKWPFSFKATEASSKALAIPNLYTDEMARGSLPLNECFITIETISKSASETYRHEDVFCLDVWKHCSLPEAKITLKEVKKGADGAFDLVIESTAPAFYVWLAVADDPAGRFSENAFGPST